MSAPADPPRPPAGLWVGLGWAALFNALLAALLWWLI
jgi:hypothetical protein